MTLEEAFQKYTNDDRLKRKTWHEGRSAHVGWLKAMVYQVKLKEKGIPFILDGMDEDAKADDWEPIKKK